MANSIIEDLIAYWKLDEASGNALDAHVGARHLTETGGTIASVSGKKEWARDFLLADTEYFLAADAAWNSITGDFTACAWVNLRTTGGANKQILAKFDATGNQRAWLLGYQNSTGRLIVQVSNDGTNLSTIGNSAFGAISVGVWYLATIRYDSANNLISVGTNGVFNYTAHSGGVFDSSAGFCIGALLAGGAGGQYWDGQIDEVGLWNRYLSDDEVVWLYNNGFGRTYEDFEAPSGQRVWAVVYDIDGTTKLGALTRVLSASIKRAINQISQWSLVVSPTDPSVAALEVGQEIDIYYEGHNVRLRGIVEDLSWRLNASGELELVLTGLGLGAELDYQQVYNEPINNLAQAAAVEAVLGNADNTWNDLITGAGYQNISKRLDHMTIWEAALQLGEISNAYIRETFTARQLELKNTHTASGIVATNREVAAAGSGKLAPISGVPKFSRDGRKLFNRVVPFGKADRGTFDLGFSNRASPYTIQSLFTVRPSVVDAVALTPSAGTSAFALSGDVVVTGENRLLLLGVYMDGDPGNFTVENVQAGGQEMILLLQYEPGSSNGASYLFYLLDPPEGTLSFHILTTAPGGQNGSGIAVSLRDVDQVSPLRDSDQANSLVGATSATMTLTTDANDLLVDLFHSYGSSANRTPGANQTELVDDGVSKAVSQQLGSDGGVMSYTFSSSDYRYHGVSVKPALIYYLEDSASVTAYRRRVKFLENVDFKEDGNITKQALANSLYDYASFYLNRHKDPVEMYQVDVAALPDAEGDLLLPGDSVRLLYLGYVIDGGGVNRVWKNVDQTLIVMSISENWGIAGERLWTLDLATQIRESDDVESFLETVGVIERLKAALANS